MRQTGYSREAEIKERTEVIGATRPANAEYELKRYIRRISVEALRMTLAITIVGRAGIWQVSDHRLTDTRTGRVLKEYSVKHVTLRCTDGTAQVSYTGAGKIGEVQISDWLRETLRGSQFTVNQSLISIRENATRDLGRRLLRERIPHVFTVGAFLSGNPWIVEITNLQIESQEGLNRRFKLGECFNTFAERVGEGGKVAAYGVAQAIARDDWAKLEFLNERRPRNLKEFHGLLAAVNRRAAASRQGAAISPECITTHMPPAGEPSSSIFHEAVKHARPSSSARPPNILISPTVFLGIDFTEMMRGMMESLWSSDLSPSHLNWEDATVSKNRLGRERGLAGSTLTTGLLGPSSDTKTVKMG